MSENNMNIEENLTQHRFTEEDRAIAYKFFCESLDASGFLPAKVQKKCQFVTKIEPNSITFLAYNKSNFLNNLRRVLGKPSSKDIPFAQYEIDLRGRLLKYEFADDKQPIQPPEQIDATNYHTFKAVYMKENKIGNVKEK